MDNHGFLRVAAAVPKLALADPHTNAERHLDMLKDAESRGVRLVVFPECSLTGYTCGDLFHQDALLRAAEESLQWLVKAAVGCYRGIAIVGLPANLDGGVYNVAAIFEGGVLICLVPKTFLPNYREFYDARYFASGDTLQIPEARFAGQQPSIYRNGFFDCKGYKLGVEICEDLWVPQPPSSRHALEGATLLVNLSASNETIGKSAYRRQLVASQSARCIAAYIYAGSGPGESTSDLVFGGHSLIAENGIVLAESPRFQSEPHLLFADIDLQHLQHDRNLTNTFRKPVEMERYGFQEIDPPFEIPKIAKLERHIDPHPFVPSNPATLKERCEEIFHIQTTALARRLEATKSPTVSIGVSGGLDSTLALLVLVKTLDLLKVPRTKVNALTMPGFGTTPRTLANAHALMKQLGVTASEVDIRAMAFEQMKALKQTPFGIDLQNETVESFSQKLSTPSPRPSLKGGELNFENTQARVRTSLLMNSGFVLGTGDLSELCLGWCTYNADHMSMYNVNVSIPKTLVRFLVKWVAEHEFDGDVRKTLLDIVDTVISPELLPAVDGKVQSTEDAIGPYELHDFFIYHMLRWGSSPAKILYLATQAKFDRDYSEDEIKTWLKVFVTRFFANQFKRNCIPDGPKVGSVSISPRGDWRMPSDASAAAWLQSLT